MYSNIYYRGRSNRTSRIVLRVVGGVHYAKRKKYQRGLGTFLWPGPSWQYRKVKETWSVYQATHEMQQTWQRCYHLNYSCPHLSRTYSRVHVTRHKLCMISALYILAWPSSTNLIQHQQKKKKKLYKHISPFSKTNFISIFPTSWASTA